MSSSTDQTHDEQVAAGEHGFGHDQDDDGVLEGTLIEPQPGQDPRDPAEDDLDSPVDDPIVMDATPVDPEDDRVVLDSHDAATQDPASPAAAGTEDGDVTYGSATGSAIPMPGGTVDEDVTPAETTMDEGIPAGDISPVDSVTPVDTTTSADTTAVDTASPVDTTASPVGGTAAPADVPFSSAVPAAGSSGATGQSAPGDGPVSPGPSRTASTEEWHEVLATFVDDPRAATQRAASLVESSAEALLASIKEQQQSLQSDWQGDGADTEKLRTALQQYRAFWTRLEGFSHQS